MKIWQRVCCECKELYGCSFINEYGEIENRGCRNCLFSLFDKVCYDRRFLVEVSHGICPKCFKKIKEERESRDENRG